MPKVMDLTKCGGYCHGACRHYTVGVECHPGATYEPVQISTPELSLGEIKQWMVETKGKGDIARRDHVEWLIVELEREQSFRELEREIAYHAARSDIECICEGHYEDCNTRTVWYDIKSTDNDDDALFVSQAVAYLEFRKLLRRHIENADLVRPLDVEVVRPCLK